MILGVVNSRREAIFRLPVQDGGGSENDIDVMVDTGFSGSLTLPPDVIVQLGLPFRSRGSAVLADGSISQFDIHTATVLWDGAKRNILVETAEVEPLVGMGLLCGCRICIDALDGGRVTLEPLAGE